MRSNLSVLLAAIVVLSAPRVEAQHLSIVVQDGRVTMDARDVPIQQVLAEWARIGGVTVVGSERISAPPVTLLLNAVPEREAFHILLRDVSGYLLAARPDAGPGSSALDRVVILPVSAAPTPLTQPALPPAIVNGRRAIGVAPSPAELADQDAVVAPQIDPQEQASTGASVPPRSARQSPMPKTTPQPAPGTSIPTFPVSIGFSGRPGDLVPLPPANPYGVNTSELPLGPLLPGSAQQPR